MAIDCVTFCRALADDTRQRILELLLEREMSVGELVESFDLSQPTISHHLQVLKQSRLVTTRRQGQQIYYAADQEHIVACCGRLFVKLSADECCGPR